MPRKKGNTDYDKELVLELYAKYGIPRMIISQIHGLEGVTGITAITIWNYINHSPNRNQLKKEHKKNKKEVYDKLGIDKILATLL